MSALKHTIQPIARFGNPAELGLAHTSSPSIRTSLTTFYRDAITRPVVSLLFDLCFELFIQHLKGGHLVFGVHPKIMRESGTIYLPLTNVFKYTAP